MNAWTHVAVVRESNNDVKLYANGTYQGKYTSNTNFSSTTMRFGGYTDSQSAGNVPSGYVDEIRLSSTARYTGNFTPQTYQFTPDANTIHLWHFNQYFTDAMNRTTLVSQSNVAKISPVRYKF